METHSFQTEDDLQSMRELIERSGRGSPADLDEVMQLLQVRARTRLWKEGGRLAAFAFVDDFNNLYFELEPACLTDTLENEVVEWGIACVRKNNGKGGRSTLDVCVEANDLPRLSMLKRHGFEQGEFRTLRYSRSLSEPIREHPFPKGFSLRCAAGEGEVEALVELHRAAFGTQNMTVEERLAIMRAPRYERDLDLLAVSPDGELAAFCICGLDCVGGQVGTTDPIGVRPRYQRLGLGKAVVTAGMKLLKSRGAQAVELGTGSDNLAMQGLAESLGFVVTSEKVWFSKGVN